DLGKDRPGQLEAVADSRDVVWDRGRGEGPGDLDAAVAGRGLVGRQRGVARAEVDSAGGDLLDARAAADGAVVDVGDAVVRRPLGDERGHEGAARAGQ